MKYRIFDKLRGRYLTKKEGFVYPDGELKVDDVGEYIVEECTGLRDKTGKFIYDGDIVIQSGGFHDEKIVVRKIGYLCNISKDSEYNDGKVQFKIIYKYEVIGNVCENPDLL